MDLQKKKKRKKEKKRKEKELNNHNIYFIYAIIKLIEALVNKLKFMRKIKEWHLNRLFSPMIRLS
jgi:hypothetical protein